LSSVLFAAHCSPLMLGGDLATMLASIGLHNFWLTFNLVVMGFDFGYWVKPYVVFCFSTHRIQWLPLDLELLDVQIDIVWDHQLVKAVDCKGHKVPWNPCGGSGHLCDLQVATQFKLVDLCIVNCLR
jgi:hypothetical protein